VVLICSKGKEKGGAVASFAWHDVRCSYVDKRGQEKEVLHGVSGYLDGGHMLAVIGTPWHVFGICTARSYHATSWPFPFAH
jgi:hypothetical protein